MRVSLGLCLCSGWAESTKHVPTKSKVPVHSSTISFLVLLSSVSPVTAQHFHSHCRITEQQNSPNRNGPQKTIRFNLSKRSPQKLSTTLSSCTLKAFSDEDQAMSPWWLFWWLTDLTVKKTFCVSWQTSPVPSYTFAFSMWLLVKREPLLSL